MKFLEGSCDCITFAGSGLFCRTTHLFLPNIALLLIFVRSILGFLVFLTLMVLLRLLSFILSFLACVSAASLAFFLTVLLVEVFLSMFLNLDNFFLSFVFRVKFLF